MSVVYIPDMTTGKPSSRIDWSHPDTRAYVLWALQDAAEDGEMVGYLEWKDAAPADLPRGLLTLIKGMGFSGIIELCEWAKLQPPTRRKPGPQEWLFGTGDRELARRVAELDAETAQRREPEEWFREGLAYSHRSIVSAYNARRHCWEQRIVTELR